MLKRYLKDGEIIKGQTCPNCNRSEYLKFESGCIFCECGWSKCS